MNRDKQIEEMAKATMNHCKMDNQCGSCHWSTCNECLAEVLYDNGYRKSAEVASEIFEEADKIFMATCLSLETYNAWCELKKKYTESEKDDG